MRDNNPGIIDVLYFDEQDDSDTWYGTTIGRGLLQGRVVIGAPAAAPAAAAAGSTLACRAPSPSADLRPLGTDARQCTLLARFRDDRAAGTSIVARLPASVPFVGPEVLERARGRPFRARLGANESAFGPAPGAITAMHAAATEGWKYGATSRTTTWKQAIAARHGVTPAHVVVGEGIDALFGTVARLHVEPGVAGRQLLLGAYLTFAFHIGVGNGGRLVTAPYRDDREDIDALLALARAERPRLAVPRA